MSTECAGDARGDGATAHSIVSLSERVRGALAPEEAAAFERVFQLTTSHTDLVLPPALREKVAAAPGLAPPPGSRCN